MYRYILGEKHGLGQNQAFSLGRLNVQSIVPPKPQFSWYDFVWGKVCNNTYMKTCASGTCACLWNPEVMGCMYVHACKIQRLVWDITLNCSPAHLQRQSVSQNLRLADSATWATNPQRFSHLCFPSTGMLDALILHVTFIHECWGPNSGPHATEQALLTEASFQPHIS